MLVLPARGVLGGGEVVGAVLQPTNSGAESTPAAVPYAQEEQEQVTKSANGGTHQKVPYRPPNQGPWRRGRQGVRRRDLSHN